MAAAASSPSRALEAAPDSLPRERRPHARAAAAADAARRARAANASVIFACSRLGNDAILSRVRVIARRTLLQFVESLKGRAGHKAVKAALDAWFHEAQRAEWRNSAEVKRSYGTASIVSADRVVFNIKGNDYRLVTAIDYRRQIVFIKWLGRHRDYDQIDARTAQYGD